MNKLYYRTFQKSFYLVSKLMPYRQPERIQGANCLDLLPERIKKDGLKTVLLVTDAGLVSFGYIQPFVEKCEAANLRVVVYDKTVPNPTITNIEEAKALYDDNGCQGIIAFGGGSPMDCAKGVAALVSKPGKTIPQLKGVMKIRKEMPPFYAIPTTAGTGSEATVAAVVTNSETHEKYALMDPVLIPHVAVLDPMLTVKLPPFVTATTGMDALTHAVEAYIGKSNTKETIEASRKAVKIIFNDLYEAYTNPTNVEARANMQEASYLAGFAFTRAFVGNVHAIAHTLGGFYQVPHGLANAVLLPYVLDFYGDTVYEPLAELADLVHLTEGSDSTKRKAEKFIAAIRQMNEKMAIPTKIEGIVNRDIPEMVKRALKEANPLYPVPKIMNASEMHYIYQMVKAE